jgi:hypothetical protein
MISYSLTIQSPTSEQLADILRLFLTSKGAYLSVRSSQTNANGSETNVSFRGWTSSTGQPATQKSEASKVPSFSMSPQSLRESFIP